MEMRGREEDEIAAILAESIESKPRSDEISPEDAAWVDSCLLSDPQTSDHNWIALREALLETLAASAISSDQDSSGACVNETSTEHAQIEEIAEPALATEWATENYDDENGESVLGSQEEVESLEEIFRVWELEAQEDDDEEENELVKQLKKALTETKYSGPPRSQSIDELITGMGDLSLEPPSDSKG